MFESFHHDNTNYGFVGAGTLFRALKTMKCTRFWFAKKQKDDPPHLTLKIIVRRKISLCRKICRGAAFSLVVNLQRSHVQFSSSL